MNGRDVIMKWFFIPLILTLSLSSNALAQRNALNELLAQENYYMLNEEFLRSERSLSDFDRGLYRSFLLAAYNQPAESNNSIKKLLASFPERISSNNIVRLQKVRIANDVKLFKYNDAWEDSNYLIKHYSNEIDGHELAELTNSNLIWKALKDVSVQEVDVQRGDSINLKRDKAGLWNVGVSSRAGNDEFILDTGANFSVVCESIARNNGWKIIEAGFDVGTVTGETVRSNIALADSISIGKSVFRNVVFLLVPDEKMTIRVNPLFTYAIKGIIGLPVIKEFGEIEIHNDGSLRIPAKITSKGYKNFVINSYTPLLYAAVDGAMLGFKFDTGANSSGLFKSYLDKYRGDVADAPTVTKPIGGAGGTRQIEAFLLKSFTLKIAGESVTLRNIPVFKEPRNRNENISFGSLGQDVLKQFSYTVVNFKDMYIELRK